MSVLDRDFLHKLKSNILFFIIYSIVFILIFKTFKYIAPFFIATIIALIINPISQKLKQKFRIDKGLSTLILSVIGVAIVITLISILAVESTKQLMHLLDSINTNSVELNTVIADLSQRANNYIAYLENIANVDVQELISKYSGTLINFIKNLISNTISIASSIPYIAMFVITLFVATYFIAKDIDKYEQSFYNAFSANTRHKVINVKKEVGKSIIGYIRAYTIIMGITFIITFICFEVFKVPYAMPLSIIAALLDLVPFLGIITIYLPFILYYWIVEKYISAISIAVVFILLSLLRQIIEPKLVSVNIGLSPLVTLAAIFIGVQVRGIIGIVFCLGLAIMHNILNKVEIL